MQIILAAVLAALLLWLSIEDFRTLRLPDIGTLPLIAAGLLINLLTPNSAPFWTFLLGVAIGFLSLWAISRFYRKVRGISGLGLGDAKLLAAAGAWMGPLYLAPTLFIGAVLALIYAGILRLRGNAISNMSVVPFGPFLSAGFFSLWCWKTFGAG